MIDIQQKIVKFLKSEYVSLYGFADLSNYQAALRTFGGAIVDGYPHGISIGISLPDSIVDFLDRRSDDNIASVYQSCSYQLVNDRLASIVIKLSTLLNDQGYRTLPIPPSERTDIDNAIPTVSHKMIAHLAGLGWIGKNCLLITPEFGPRIRFVSLLTHAPLRQSHPVMESRCGTCMACTNICPSKAIKGVAFNSNDEREVRMDFRNCQEYFDSMKSENPKHKAVCGMCLYVCPFGRKRKSSIELSAFQ